MFAKHAARTEPTPISDAVLAPSVSAQYCFTMTADIAQRFVGEIQGGYRVDLDYTGGAHSVAVRYSCSALGSSLPHLKGASVNSGSDWVFLSRDAIADFDSRVTILLGPDPMMRCLVGARLRGRADLRNCRYPDGSARFTLEQTAAEILAIWQGGLDEGSYLPLALAVAIDVPVEGFDAAQTQVYEDCRELGRSLLLGTGNAFFRKAPTGEVRQIVLDVSRVNQPPGTNKPERST